MLWAGRPFFERAVQSMAHRSPNMWTLIGLGTSAAFVYSLVATVAPGLFPVSYVSMGRVSVYFEAAAVIISLTLLGQILEFKARSQTSAAIKSFVMWGVFGPEPSRVYGPINAVAVLIIGCQCALGLATPMSGTGPLSLIPHGAAEHARFDDRPRCVGRPETVGPGRPTQNAAPVYIPNSWDRRRACRCQP